MRSLDIGGALRRRWYVLLAGTLATAALAVAAYAQIGASYELRASAVLLPPSVSVVAPETRELVNPFLRLDGIDPALSVLVTKLMAEEFSDRMLESSPGADYTVAEDPVSQAPIVVVIASSSDPDEAATVLDRVTVELPTVLDDLQDEAGITPSARITLLPLIRDDEPARVLGGLLRIEILLIAAGLVGTLLLAGLWDALARSRAAAASAPPAAAVTAVPPLTTPPVPPRAKAIAASAAKKSPAATKKRRPAGNARSRSR